MGWMKERVKSWLEMAPVQSGGVLICEPMSYEEEVLRNRLWYRGQAAELHQFFTQMDDGVHNNGFWAATASTGVPFRKIHTGLPQLMVDVLANLVLGDMIGVVVDDAAGQAAWDAVAGQAGFAGLLKTALARVLVEGDGAFKICVEAGAPGLPVLEFYAGYQLRYERVGGQLRAVVFCTPQAHPDKRRPPLMLEERYAGDGVSYRLLDHTGKEMPLATVPALATLRPVHNPGGFMMAVPLMLEASARWPGRGKSLFDAKSGAFDALDEVFSQWMDALRDGRSTRYIPEGLVPQRFEDGTALRPNSFDNRYVQCGADLREDGRNEIRVVAGEINHEPLLATYVTALDLCLQGVVSPCTLGIDVKKLDNAEAQREKEKATLYTRGKLVAALEKTLPCLVAAVLNTKALLEGLPTQAHAVSVSFGEYANPSFEAQVETVGKARQQGIMSLERAVEELYGGSLTRAEKAEEVGRLRAERE